MSLLSESQFFETLPKHIRTHKLIDRNVLTIINSYNNFDNNLQLGLEIAIKGNFTSMISVMIEKGAKPFSLEEVCKYARIEIVKLMISLGSIDYGEGLVSASKKGDLEVVSFLIGEMSFRKEETKSDTDSFCHACRESIQQGHFPVFRFLYCSLVNTGNNPPFKGMDSLQKFLTTSVLFNWSCACDQLLFAKFLLQELSKLSTKLYGKSYYGLLKHNVFDTALERANPKGKTVPFLKSEILKIHSQLWS